MKYDYLIVGTGLFGAVFARQMVEAGRTVLLLEKEPTIGGNVKDSVIEGIQIHQHGPHIFHTNNYNIWCYVNKFAKFNHYQHRVKATFQNKIYTLPFNLATYYELWGVTTPQEAQQELERQRVQIKNPANLEEWALSHVGSDIYDKLIYGYTKKQWNREPRTLPASIIKRLPLRTTFDNNYFNDHYQGIPIDGYSKLVQNIIGDIPIRFDDFFSLLDWKLIAQKLVFTGAIDQFYNFKFGPLEYRSLRFESQIVEGDFQGISQMNYTDENIPYTRIIEHKHFSYKEHARSVITYEYPDNWDVTKHPYYPVNDDGNNALYAKYKTIPHGDILFGGRLSTYRYMNMDETVGQALTSSKRELNSKNT